MSVIEVGLIMVFFTVLVRFLFFAASDDICPHCGKENKINAEFEADAEEIKYMMMKQIDMQKCGKKNKKGLLDKDNIMIL